jgi:DNA-3-methyladenine glycosylase II
MPTEAELAHAFLLDADPALGALVAAHGPVDAFDWPGTPPDGRDLLAHLVRDIAGQQLSEIAARAIYGRLVDLLGGVITPEGLASQSEADLRAAGLSGAKIRAVTELGQRVLAGDLDLDRLADVDDAEAQARLVALRGIGPWSAQMFLLHGLRRPDVFPGGDLGLRQALVRLDGLEGMPTPRAAAERALPWSPYRSYAAAHLWRSLRE